MNDAAFVSPLHPDHVKFFSEGDVLRFWEKVNLDGPLPDQSVPHYTGLEKCWVWTKPAGRYGISRGRKKSISSHRASWLLHHGTINEGLFVLHRCDNSKCVNPSHLFLGTALDNNRDRANKKRSAYGDRNGSRLYPERLNTGDRCWQRRNPEKVIRGKDHCVSKNPLLVTGVKNPAAKLTEAQVLEIRARYAAGGIFQYVLAKEYSVTQGLITSIVRRKTWRHI